MTAFSPCQ